jgi:DNA (cytosine-5)-methyltransferase 1
MSSRNTYKVIDLFAGLGGLSYGFARNRRFEVVAANELLAPMARAYSLNHRHVKMYQKDINDFVSTDVEKDLTIRRSDIDVIIGGPPCQAFSTIGKRLLDDPRGLLFREYCRVLKDFKPRLFLFENVMGLLSMSGGELIKTIVALFESLGYTVLYKVLDAADYGVPQRRKRVIMVGTLGRRPFEYPSPTHYDPASKADHAPGLMPYLTLADAIGDLPLVESDKYMCPPQNEYQSLMRARAPEKVIDHNGPKNNPNLVRLMESLPEGGGPHDLNELPGWFVGNRSYSNSYCRLWWNRPCCTITRNFSTPSSSRCIHPLAPRPLTTREGARIQSFPDDFVFCGSRSDRNLQIGNAVPPLLSAALAKAVARHLSGRQERCRNTSWVDGQSRREFVSQLRRIGWPWSETPSATPLRHKEADPSHRAN